MYKRIVLFYAAVLSGLLLATPTYAGVQEVLQSFASAATITIPEISVPTAVDIMVPGYMQQGQSLGLYNQTEEVFVPFITGNASPVEPVSVQRIDQVDAELSALVDKRHDAHVDFEIDAASADSRVTLRYTFERPIVSDELSMSLAQYVVRPTLVSIKVGTPEGMKYVLSPVAPTGNSIVFPKTEGSVWEVTLVYKQPLRLTELAFQTEADLYMDVPIRFLAYPGRNYTLFYNPEVILDQQLGEIGDLRAAMAVQKGSIAAGQLNPLYIPADSDMDGRTDANDNCPRHANEEQEDIDENGRGDVCDDFDLDGHVNAADNCHEVPNRDQADTDTDGIGDVCDGEESRVTERYPWLVWVALGVATAVFVGLFLLAIRHREDDGDTPAANGGPAQDQPTV
jgi:hypothetical protein